MGAHENGPETPETVRTAVLCELLAQMLWGMNSSCVVCSCLSRSVACVPFPPPAFVPVQATETASVAARGREPCLHRERLLQFRRLALCERHSKQAPCSVCGFWSPAAPRMLYSMDVSTSARCQNVVFSAVNPAACLGGAAGARLPSCPPHTRLQGTLHYCVCSALAALLRRLRLLLKCLRFFGQQHLLIDALHLS